MVNYSAGKINELLDNSLKYKEKLGLPKKFADNEAFRLGDQWGAVTENTKNFPRPVMNICDYIITHKTSSIQNADIKLIYTEYEDTQKELGKKFSLFADKEWERLKMTSLCSDLLDNSATKGVAQCYFYIVPDIKGKVKMGAELIDAANFHVSNPKQTDIQKQSWVIVLQRLPLDDVKELAEYNNVKEDIIADKEIKGQEYANKDTDMDGVDKVNLINFFYKDRASGNIFVMKICGQTIVQPAMDLLITKFPFACLQWSNVTESYYSKSEIDYLKTNQKQINALAGLQIMNIQLQGFPKMFSKKGALNPNSVKGTVGEILIDNSPGQNLNFGWLQPAPINNQALMLQDNLINQTKNLAGAHDVDTGSAKADNATAIMLLQRRSGVAIDKLRRKFHQYAEDVGLIWLEFFCSYYTVDRTFTYKDEMGVEQTETFNAEGVTPGDLDLKIDIGQSTQYSDEFTVSSLDKFLQLGLIDFKTYLKYVPDNVVPFRNSLLKDIEIKEQQQAQEAQDYLMSQMSPEELAMFNSLDKQSQQKILLDLTNREEQEGLQEQRALNATAPKSSREVSGNNQMNSLPKKNTPGGALNGL